ncbi:Glyoxalase domain-containing protein 4, partial [Blomia tropicalis]
VLRHEEFNEMCNAQCNGPYDGKWSKTMIGYGPENKNFVLELTYNYGVANYKRGNDLVGIRIESKAAYENVLKNDKDWIFMHKNPESLVLNSPDGYLFEIYNASEEQLPSISKVTLLSSNLDISKNYWHGMLGMNIDNEDVDLFSASYSTKDAKLEFLASKGQAHMGELHLHVLKPILPHLQESMIEKNQTILTRLVSLDTPGKATVQVVILADPDGHEICFVGEKGFSELSQVDPNANESIDKAMSDDKSDEWFAKKGIVKETQQ